MSKTKKQTREAKEDTLEPKEPKLIFKRMGNLLTKLSMKEQLEISIIALAGLCVALLITAIYMIGWMDMSMFMNIMTGVNAFFGIVFLLMNLAGMYASYKQIALVESTIGDPTDLLKQLTQVENSNGDVTFDDSNECKEVD